MGEMADDLIEQMDANIDTEFVRVQKHPVCRHCGKRNLRWRQVAERWVLYEKKAPHRCPNHPLPLDVLKKLAEDTITAQRTKK